MGGHLKCPSYLYIWEIFSIFVTKLNDMALNITINKTAVATSYPAGSTVATAVASGGTTPYT